MNRRQVMMTLGAACAVPALPTASFAAGPPIRILTSAIDAAAEPYYAQDMRFFRDAGIDVQITEAANGAAVTNAIAAGAADIGIANLTSLVTAISKGIPFTIVAPASVYDHRTPTSALLVSKSSPIQRARDLNGKVIAAAGLGTITEYAARVWVDKNGGDAKTLRFVEMTQPTIPDALVAGRVDAAVLAEPWLYQGKKVARVLSAAYDAIAPRFLVAGFFAHTEWAKANVPAVARFQATMAKTAVWANAHHDESGKILEKYGKYPPGAIASMLRIAFQPAFDTAEMQPLIDVLTQYGIIAQSIPAEKLIFRTT